MVAYKGGRAAAQKRYNSKPTQIKRRTARNRARRLAERAGLVRKGDGKDVEHKDGNPLHTPRKGTKNLAVGSKHHNRSYPRTRGAHKRNPRD